jgi:F-type H+-transporting ATPase subunit epsilon
VTRERCTVLAEEAMPLADLDRAAIEAEARTAREDAGLAKDAAERAAVERRLAVAEAKLAILQQAGR